MVQESHNEGKIISVDSRPIRAVGDSIGCTFDKRALRELGLVGDDGELAVEVSARQVIYDSGEVELELDLEDVPEDVADRVEIVAD